MKRIICFLMVLILLTGCGGSDIEHEENISDHESETEEYDNEETSENEQEESEDENKDTENQIVLEFGVENEYSSLDECTNGMEYWDESTYPKKEVYSYIYNLPEGTYQVTYGYKYPRENGLFYIEDDTIYEDEPGYFLYENIQYIKANYYEPTQITLESGQHIRLDVSDTKFIFIKID